ncbi:MAG: hypothetical protein U0235_35195 [Polyangiaceae bacterium]
MAVMLRSRVADEERSQRRHTAGASSWEDHRHRVLGHERVYFWSMPGDPTPSVRC